MNSERRIVNSEQCLHSIERPLVSEISELLHGLCNALRGLSQADAHIAFALLAKHDAGRDGDIHFFKQLSVTCFSNPAKG